MTPSADALPVLLVDDDEMLRRTMTDILALRGFAPSSAADGEQAMGVARAMSPPPAVAIVDLRLPDMDGLDLAARLQEQTRYVQVVILTGHASIESAVRALRDNHGCDYLVKPVEVDQLIRTLKTAEDRWRLVTTEAELRETRALVQTVFDASPLPHVLIGLDMKVRLWNPAAERVFGWQAVDVVGRELSSIAPAWRGCENVVEVVRQGHSIMGLEVRRSNRAGAPLDVRLNAAAFRERDGSIEAVLSVYEDVTERRELERKLNEAQRLDAIGRLAGGIAHDFNNLLTVIRSETDLALQTEALDERLRGGLISIRDTTDRGAALTRQLLAFARRQPVTVSMVEPDAVVAELDRMLRRLIGPGVRLEVDAGATGRQVGVDRSQLEQVLTNLVVNARDAMPDGGRLTVTTRHASVRPGAELLGLDPGEWVIISVRDTGTGIPEEQRTRIFEPFFTTKAQGAGTGLGLATCYGIVRRLGGQMVVESEIAIGSTFHVCLPHAEGESVQELPAPDADAPSGTETILLVEDQDQLRSATQRLLRNRGYQVRIAGSVGEAWELISTMPRRPDLVMSDVQLPDGGGRDLIVALQASFPGLRALLTSGSYDVGDVGDARIPFLQKPYSLQDVAGAVRAVLDGTYQPPGQLS